MAVPGLYVRIGYKWRAKVLFKLQQKECAMGIAVGLFAGQGPSFPDRPFESAQKQTPQPEIVLETKGLRQAEAVFNHKKSAMMNGYMVTLQSRMAAENPLRAKSS
ncbi:MAG: hypothetical protein HQL79_08975 [Magnetococcales bacterium]|nr:hypothetical protein [Magnetococcales bacterium]